MARRQKFRMRQMVELKRPSNWDETKYEQTSNTVQLMRASKTSQKRVKSMLKLKNDGCMLHVKNRWSHSLDISIITILSPDSMLTPFSSTRGRRPVCTAGGSSTRSFCALLHRTDSTNRLLTTVGDVEICHEIQAMFLFPVVKVCSKHQDAFKK